MKWIEFLENKLMRFVLDDVYWVDYEGFCSMIENISYRITKKNLVFLIILISIKIILILETIKVIVNGKLISNVKINI